MTQVNLHIYDVGTDAKVGKLNEHLSAMGTGAFHGGVEVNGVEWSYGYNPDATGVFCCKPKSCDAHTYRQTIDMGKSDMSKSQIDDLVLQLKATWPGFEYDLLRHNCVVFSNFFCVQLGVGPVPAWVTNLSGAGATLMDGFEATKKKVEPLAIIAAAKAGEIDAKYDLSGKTQAGAKKVLEAAGKFDEEYKVREKTFAAAAVAQVKAKEGWDKTKAKAAEVHKGMDTDGDGQLSIQELKMFFIDKAERAPDFLQSKAWEAQAGISSMKEAIVKAADKDGDGKLNFKEAADHLAERARQFESDYKVKDKAKAAAVAMSEKAKQVAAFARAKADQHFAKADDQVPAKNDIRIESDSKSQCGACNACIVQ